MNLFVITHPEPLEGESVQLTELFEAGLNCLHVRKPAYSLNDVSRYLESIPQEFHKRLVLHSHHQLSEDFDLRGIHLPESLRQTADGKLHACGFFRKDLTYSTSVHSLDDLHNLEQAPRATGTCCSYDYIFLSPIFDSISKPGHQAAFDLDKLTSELRQIQTPVVALGGITADKFSSLSTIGFWGAAFLGAVWLSLDPAASYRLIEQACVFNQHQQAEIQTPWLN